MILKTCKMFNPMILGRKKCQNAARTHLYRTYTYESYVFTDFKFTYFFRAKHRKYYLISQIILLILLQNINNRPLHEITIT